MKPGQMIKVRGYGSKELVRHVVQLDKDIVVVCSPEEYEAAQLQGREPIGVGFHITDVIDENIEDEQSRIRRQNPVSKHEGNGYNK